MKTEIAYKIKLLRKKNNFSVKDLKNKLKIRHMDFSEQTIYKWEEGAVVPNLHVLQALAEIFDIDISYLIDNEILEFKTLTPIELFLLNLYRNDFLFQNICVLIIRKYNRIAL